ncbi:hypothetical protein TWF217_003850 [Orbilia oligospora]|nr:hypothetical protein TWF217_003850 [Orbilia oligospora]
MIPPANSTKQHLKLLDLSEDLLRTIFYQNVGEEDLKSLRLVHHGFHSTVNPLLFGKIIIKIYHYEEQEGPGDICGDGKTIIRSVGADNLSTCKTPSILHQQRFSLLVDNVQNVEIRYYDISESTVDAQGVEGGVLECDENNGLGKIQIFKWRLPCSGIRRLTNLSSIVPTSAFLEIASTISCNEPLDTALNNLDFLHVKYSDIEQRNALSCLPQFPMLDLEANTSTPSTLPGDYKPPNTDSILFLAGTIIPLNRRRITLNRRQETTPTTEKLNLTEPFLSNLQTLDLQGLHPSGSRRILQTLKENKIHLRSLTIDGYNLDIIDYLTSYTNKLQFLKLVIHGDETEMWEYGERLMYRSEAQEAIDEFKSRLWKFAISAHAETLESLAFLGHFRFCEEASDTLQRCNTLNFIALRAEDECFQQIFPIIANIRSIRLVEFKFPAYVPHPSWALECGGSISHWDRRMANLQSRIENISWSKWCIKDSDSLEKVRVAFAVEESRYWSTRRGPIPASGTWKLYKERQGGRYWWKLTEDVKMKLEGVKEKDQGELEEGGKKVVEEEVRNTGSSNFHFLDNSYPLWSKVYMYPIAIEMKFHEAKKRD